MTQTQQIEILAPVGSREMLSAAVYSGADAVYLGFSGLNARSGAGNFDAESLKEAVAFCHGRGVKVHVAMNTTLYGRELAAAAKAVEAVAAAGADAVICQDLAVAALCRQIAPGLPRHGSTQMSVHTLAGAQQLVKLFPANGIRPVLVTGSGQNTLINRLEADFDGAFTERLRVTSHNVKRGKPDPEPYLMALKMADVDASRAFVLENAPLGVESGARAGIFTIAVATGPVPLQTLDDAGASIVFSSMPQCLKFFPDLLYCLNK